MAKTKFTDSFIKSLPAPEKQTEMFDASLEKFGLRLYPTGTKTFFIAYHSSQKGNVQKFNIGKYPTITLYEARKRARDLIAKLQMGIDPVYEKQKNKLEALKATQRITFDELCTQFIRDHVSKLRQHSQNDYISRINKHIRPAFSTILVEDFTRRDARRFIGEFVDNNQPVHGNRIHAVLAKMLNFAVEYEYIKVNPIIGLRKMGKETSRDRYYSPDEITALWSAFESEGDPVHGLLKILLLTGQRRGEVSKMKWTDIDFTNNVWTIPASNTKNKIEHYIPLVPDAVGIIKSLYPLTGEQEFVFNSLKVDNTIISGFSKISTRICKKSGISDFRFHDLRRTVATYIAKDGTPKHVLKKILNHTEGKREDITNVYDRYDYMDEKRTALLNWERTLKAIITGEQIGAKITHLKSGS